jgi:hypothetical protein
MERFQEKFTDTVQIGMHILRAFAFANKAVFEDAVRNFLGNF